MRPKNRWALSLLAVFFFGEAIAQNGDNKQKRHITECDKEIGKILCDNFQAEMVKCADLMPPEEPPFFYECAKENSLVDTDNMEQLLQAVCSQKAPVETAWDMVECWNEKMEEAVKTMKDDKVYPEAHFKCKKKIFKDALKKATCPCQMEKGQLCDIPKAFG